MIGAGLATGLGLVYWLGYRQRLRVVGARRFGAQRGRMLAFYLGLVLLALLESPPLTQLGERFFWARTAQLMSIVMVVAPLLVLGALPTALARLFRLGRRPQGGNSGGLAGAIAAFVLLNAGLWLWHLPALYEASVSSPELSNLTDLAFACLAFFFWAQVIDQARSRAPLGYLHRAIYLFLASMQLRILALVLAFAQSPFYSHYVAAHGNGASALVDQQLGAGIMLVPGVITDTVAVFVCLFLWLGEEERKAPRETFRMYRSAG